MTTAMLRHKLQDYIQVADTKKLQSIYNLLENEIEAANEWWNNKAFVAELDARDEALENGTDKGVTIEQLKSSIAKLREKKYGKK